MKQTVKVTALVLIYILFIVMLSNAKSSLSYVAYSQSIETERKAVREFQKNGQKFYILDSFTAEVSAYSSSVQETDDTPFLTASGDHVAHGTIACPSRFAFGTPVLIYNEIYFCNDRMAKRFRDGNFFDVWTTGRDSAFLFGRKNVTVSILTKDIHIAK